MCVLVKSAQSWCLASGLHAMTLFEVGCVSPTLPLRDSSSAYHYCLASDCYHCASLQATTLYEKDSASAFSFSSRIEAPTQHPAPPPPP